MNIVCTNDSIHGLMQIISQSIVEIPRVASDYVMFSDQELHVDHVCNICNLQFTLKIPIKEQTVFYADRKD